MTHHKPIAILYHGGCPDGFGAAYAAWKKFGDGADYIPVKYGNPISEGIEGSEVFLVDFCYKKPELEQLQKQSRLLTVLDHHEGARDLVEGIPNHVFDSSRSGATIAWDYFHPDAERPRLLEYVEDGDLYLFKLPDARAILSFIYAEPFNFKDWDRLAPKLEDPSELKKIIERGATYAEYFAALVGQTANKATLVSFEGYECYLVGASDQFASDLGHTFYQSKPPIGIVVVAHANYWNVSLRSDGSVDVASIAKKYGGGGHPAASGFRIKWGDPLPWKVVKEHEDPRH